MFSPNIHLLARLSRKATSSGIITRAKLYRLASVILIGCLLASSTPAAPGVIGNFTGRMRLGFQAPVNGLVSWLKARALPQGLNRGMPLAPVNLPGVRPPAPPTSAELFARVASLRLNSPAEVTLESRQRVLFSATPLDSAGEPIHGLHVGWESSNRQVMFVSRAGEARAGSPGTATLIARAGTAIRSVQVTVVEGDGDEFGGRQKPDSQISARQTGRNPFDQSNIRVARRTRIRRHHTPPMVPLRDPNDDPLPDNETSSLYQASNAVGSPPGKKRGGALTPASATTGTEAGNQNFSFGLPIFGLPGRGINASLALVYNSQVWNKSINPNDQSTRVTYDVDSGWPATGFRIGYGQIENQGGFGFTLTDADGTRHALVYTSTYNYDTTDGTFIHFYGSSGAGTLYYPDGTQVSYSAGGGGYRIYPTKIMDRNGNYILVSYLNSVGPKIDSIEDTLGRYVHFYYATNGDLVTITAPGLTGQSDRQVMRFYYDDVTIPSSGLFASGITVNGGPTTFHTLRYIYLPSATESANAHLGYKFDYSCYGMMYQIKQFRGMTVSSTSTTTAGTVSEGTQAALTTYDYPTTASSLSDVPTYAHRTDDWAGRTTGMPGSGNAPYYTFATSTLTGEKVSTVTAPDGTIVETHSIDSSGAWNDGLVKETVVEYGTPPNSTTLVSDTVIEWEQTPGSGPPRVADVKVTNESGLTKATVLSYTSYNNVSAVSERDFTTDGSISTTELRRTETTYVTLSSYTNRHLLHLPSTVKVFPGGSSTPSARVDYAYDNYGTNHANLTARADIIMHDEAFNPFTLEEDKCYENCLHWKNGICTQWGWVCPYDPATDRRGNVTSVTTYPDATSSNGTITHSTTYDIAGNVMTDQVDCCQLKSFTYSGGGAGGNHDYAYPISVTSGSGGTTLTSSATYDYNTGVVATSTDENSQVTNFYYNTDSLRPEHTDYPDGGYVSYHYNDNLYNDVAGHAHYFATTYSKIDSTHYLDSYRFYDGRGALAQTFDNYAYQSQLGSYNWSTQDIEYDAMGRAYRASNPYYCGGYAWVGINPDGFWTTASFDHAGRVTQVTMPRGDNDNSLTTNVQTSYAGIYTTVTDQAGKQRRQKVDALGRVIRLDEPTTSGLGTIDLPNQATNYTYDVLDNLVRINQGSQDRYLKYDSLSRLIRERQVEQDTNSSYNLSDPVTGNSSWSRKIDYNSSGLVTDAYDARGVHTTLSYDGLNRLTQVSYSDSTPTGHYYYDSQTLPTGAPSPSSPDYYSRGYSAGRLVAMTYGSGATGNYFGYDQVGQVNMQFQLTGSTPTKYKLTYGYNYLGQLASETYPSGRALTYAYDDGARLYSAGDGTTTFANGFQYAAHGGLSSETWGNTSVHTTSYNRRLQASQAKLSLGSSVLQQYDYGYGEFNTSTGAVDTSKNNGQIGKITGTIGTTTQWLQGFQYDELGRLKNVAEYQSGSMSSQTYSQGYTFDRYGNRFQSANSTLGLPAVSSSEINAATNRFINSGSTPTTYDAAGNITTDTKFRGMNYSYDANSRMTFAETTAHANQQTSVYDCAGQRVKTTVGSATRTMVYDIFGQDVADYSGSTGGTLERENIYRGGQLLATYEAGSSALKYVLTDVQGSTRALMNNSGGSSTVIARHDYLPFGEEISSGIGLRTGSQGYGATDTNRQKYGLTERDDTTGLDHTWWRKYENLSGRWSSPDPYNGSMAIGDPQSFNRFAYTQNDPVNSVDPSGLLMIIIVQNPWGSDPFADFYASIGWPYEDGGGWDPGLDPGGGRGGVPQNSFAPLNQWWNPRWIKCPPVQFKITGIGPNQAPGTTAISQTARADIPDGGVAIKPTNFGVKGINGNNRSVFLNMRFSVDWTTATPANAPAGIPTQGPFFPVDNIGPASVRNSPGNMIDVYNYQSTADALASTRTGMVTTWIPENSAGVTCPK